MLWTSLSGLLFFVSYRFWIVVSSFSFVSRKFFIPSLISFLTHSFCLIACYSVSMILSVLGFFLWGWFLVLVPCGQRKCLIWFQFSEFVEACFVSYHVVHVWICSMCMWKECVFFFFVMKSSLYISVKSISSRVLLSDTISLLIFSLEGLSIFISGVLKSPI